MNAGVHFEFKEGTASATDVLEGNVLTGEFVEYVGCLSTLPSSGGDALSSPSYVSPFDAVRATRLAEGGSAATFATKKDVGVSGEKGGPLISETEEAITASFLHFEAIGELTPKKTRVIESVEEVFGKGGDACVEKTHYYRSLLQLMISFHSVEDISTTGSYSNPVDALNLEDVRKTLQWLNEKGTDNLLDQYVAPDSVSVTHENNGLSKDGCSNSKQRYVDPQLRDLLQQNNQRNNLGQRFPNRQIFRRKLVLLGHQEVGKTSLRKCFESEPYFFKRLPEVRATAGVKVCSQPIRVGKDNVHLIISDFAGQESYHSHTFFMTDRTIFLLVWKISSVEQDFKSSGISANEEERLYKWIAEVYAKFPRAKIALVGTHLDELRVQGQRSVENILMKVEGKILSFMQRIAAVDPNTGQKVINEIVGNFAVSCKTRHFIAAGKLRHLSGQTLSALLRFFAEVAHKDCMEDKDFPAAAIPGRHIKLLEEVIEKKRLFPNKFLMPLSDFVHSAVKFGVESDAELLQIACLMHSWDNIYLFNPHRLSDNTFVMLHSHWLSRLASALFSYPHILHTPLHLRSAVGPLEYSVSEAEAADMHLIMKGFLRWPLVRTLFRSPLYSMLGRDPNDLDYMVAVRLLAAQGLLFPVEIPCDDFSILEEETPIDIDVGRPVVREARITRYFVPSLSPYSVPDGLKKLAPVLFNRGLKLKLEFNLLPNEVWWRFQAQLHSYQQIITLHEPREALLEKNEDMLDDHRLFEADQEHNQWNDAMWLKGDYCRVLLYREGLHVIRIFFTETRKRGAEEVLTVVEKVMTDLLKEYRGMQRKANVACPRLSCDGWLLVSDVLTEIKVTCPACGQVFDSDDVIASDIEPCVHLQFSDALLKETGELLYFSLGHRDCVRLSEYLGFDYQSPDGVAVLVDKSNESNDSNVDTPTQLYIDCMCAFDKVVRAAMLRQMHGRMEEEMRRRRLLEQVSSRLGRKF